MKFYAATRLRIQRRRHQLERAWKRVNVVQRRLKKQQMQMLALAFSLCMSREALVSISFLLGTIDTQCCSPGGVAACDFTGRMCTHLLRFLALWLGFLLNL